MSYSFNIRKRATALATALGLGAVAVVATAAATPAAATPAPVMQRDTTQLTADALPTVQIDGVVWSQVVIGNTVYAGGSFTTARPAGAAAGVNTTPRANLLAYNLTTGELITTFAPAFNAQVLSVAASPDGSRLYVGGDFTTIDGQPHYRLAAISTTTGAAVPQFSPIIDYRVKAIVATSTTVYAGGGLSTANGQPRASLAAFQASDGALTTWNPGADDIVNAMVMSPDGSRLIVGGAFKNIGGQPGYGMASIDVNTGLQLPWAAVSKIKDAGVNAAITSLTTDGTSIFGTGYVFGGGGNLEGAFSADPNTGNINWIEDCHGDTYSAFPIGTTLYTVSHAHWCYGVGGFPQTDPWSGRHGNAFTTYATGTLNHNPFASYTDWYGTPSPSVVTWWPDMTTGTFTGQAQAAWNVSGNSQYLVMGGEFPTVNGVGQQGLVRFAVKALAPNKQAPMVSGANFKPTLTSLSPNSVHLAWQANWDRDDKTLTYQVSRDGQSGTPIYTVTADSTFWTRPALGFTDNPINPTTKQPLLTAGSTHTYRLFASDKWGNKTAGDTVTYTIPATASTPSYGAKLIADGASNYYPLNEASGTTVFDNAGYTDDTATSTGVTRGGAGAIAGDTATGLDGSTGGFYSKVGQDGPDQFTVSAWFKTTTAVGGKILGFASKQIGLSGSYDRHIYMDNTGKLNFGAGKTTVVTSPAAYNDGQWHQVAASLSSDGMALYVDGARVARRTDVTAGLAYYGYWRAGGDNLGGWPNKPTSAYFNGAVDEVAIFPTALSRTTVASEYQASGRTLTLQPAPGDSYGAAVYNDDPDLYWRLGDSAKTSVVDSGPYNLAGDYVGTETLGATGAVVGTTDTAVAFGGTNGFAAARPSVTNPNLFSEEAWFQTTTTRGGKIIGFGNSRTVNSTSYDRHVYMQNDGTLVYGVNNGAQVKVVTPKAYNDGGWHHVVATLSSAGMKLYVDGNLVGSNAATTGQNYAGYWRVGGDVTWGSASNYFAGTIDEAAVYSTALTAQQVAAHYSIGTTGGLQNSLPTASFASSVADLSASVDASASKDSDGSIASYAWDFGDSSTGTGVTATHTYAAGGTYSVKLTVTDNRGGTGTASNQVTVLAPNAPPTAAFGSTTNALAASFDAAASADSDGSIASYAWNFGDSGTGTGATPTHTYATSGTYSVTLTVTDNRGGVATVTHPVTVQAANQPPSAAFTAAATNLSVAFDGSGSSDPDGTISSYAWDFGDGVTGTGATTQHTYAAGGAYTVKLTVTDSQSAAGTVSKQVTVSSANVAPTAAFTSSATNLVLSVDGSTSSDPDGTISSYAWDFGDGVTGTGATAQHTYAAGGAYTVKLTVTDSQAASGTVSKQITVSSANVAPKAAFTTGATNLALSVDGSTSSDPDGTISSYAWDFGDGGTGTGATAQHTYAAAGTYTVTLTVTDNGGATNSTSQQIAVTAPLVAVYASDAFTRTTANSLGSADKGGAWSLAGGASTLFSVSGGSAKLKMSAPSAGPAGYLNSVSALNVDGVVDVSSDSLPTGSGTYLSLAVRHTGSGATTSEYRVRVKIQPTTTTLTISKVVNNTETALKNVTVAGLVYASGDVLRLRILATGSGTTSLSGKVWKVGSAEPSAWLLSTTDVDPALQSAGGVGVVSYLSGTSTVSPVVSSWDNLAVTAPAA